MVHDLLAEALAVLHSDGAEPAPKERRERQPRKLDTVAKAIARGGNFRYSAGGGLALYVRGKSALWIDQGRGYSHSLGSAKGESAMGLKEARNAQIIYRASLLNGTAAPAGKSTGKTFGEAVEEFIQFKSKLPNGDAWRGGAGGEEATAYRRTLKGLWETAVATIDTPTIGNVLEKMKARTAEKTRMRIKGVLDWSKAKGYRSGDNPAAKILLAPRLTPAPKAKHHPAVPWADMPVLMKELLAIDTAPARALAWTILNASRTAEARDATWGEIDGDTWTIPGSRMKEGKTHRVPLTPAALALPVNKEGLLFGAISEQAMLRLLKALRPGMTVHGLRSTFTDWAVEKSGVNDAKDLADHALAHIQDEAYRRTDMFDKRRMLMQAWAEFATSVLSLGR